MIVVTNDVTVWVTTDDSCFSLVEPHPEYFAGIGKPNFPVPATRWHNPTSVMAWHYFVGKLEQVRLS